MRPEVEVVVINWRRPANVRRIVRAFRRQPCRLTLVDVAEPAFALDAETHSLCDEVYQWRTNQGGYNRYVPLGGYQLPYTYFHDDDMLPGERVVEHLLSCAKQQPQFSVLGQFGRLVEPGRAYVAEEVPQAETFRAVDAVVRGYFVRTEHLSYVPQFMRRLGLHPPLEDDLLLCLAIQTQSGMPSLLTPASQDSETKINKEELPDPFALRLRPDHQARRTEFLRQAEQHGWRSLASKHSTVCDPSTKCNSIQPAFGITVYDEGEAQLESCLCSLRSVYLTAPVFVVSDGLDLPGYREICRRHRADYEVGERLKTEGNGARWWRRFFSKCLAYNAHCFFKVDPDTRFHRPFRELPTLDIFGTIHGDNVQGGIQGISRFALRRIVDSAICDDSMWLDESAWATCEQLREYARRTGQVSTDGVLMSIAAHLGLTKGDWPEVHSHWTSISAFRPDVAATHPHKQPTPRRIHRGIRYPSAKPVVTV